MTQTIETTQSGARVVIISRGRTGYVLVRDDGHPVYGASSRWDVVDYLRRYGDVIQPSPPGKPLLF